MRGILSPTSATMGKGLGKDVALITDDRFSAGSHGFVVGHVTPEAYVGGAIALVKNGDSITIEAEKRLVMLDIPAGELKKRKKAESAEAPLHPRCACKIRGPRHQRLARRGDGCGVEVVTKRRSNMQIDHVTIRNFRSLEDITIGFNDYYAAMSGENNSGTRRARDLTEGQTHRYHAGCK